MFKMFRFSFRSLCVLVLLSAVSLKSQDGSREPRSASTQPGSQPSMGAEQADYVVLYHRIRLAYQSDGTSEKVEEGRVRVQTEAGVNAMGQLRWGYSAANETLEVVAVKVHKAEGRVVVAPKESVQDLALPGTEQMTVYTDLRLKLVTVPALRPGDEVEYTLRTPRTSPYAPGHFWGEHRFSREEIVMEASFELDVPAQKAVHVVSTADLKPKVREHAGRRVTTWSWSHPRMEPEGKRDSSKPRKTKAPGPDLQFTTFGSWAEMGDWYASLEAPQRALDEGLRAKARALVAGKTTPLEKVEALYSFVSTTNRYVSLSFGVGRFQPHKASEVFANQYGDCKDKHTLLAALLESEGFQVASVLIHTSRTLDPDLPSPAQFDHVFTEVNVQGESVLLDTTAEVAPFRSLLRPFRKKQALRVVPSGASRLFTTPSSNAKAERVEVDAEGEVTAKGDVKAIVKQHFAGDQEVILRSVFRKVPQLRWKEVVGFGATMDGLFGEVSDIQVSDPGDLSTPFNLTFTFAKAQAYTPTGGSGFLSPPISRIRFEFQEGDPGSVRVGEGSARARLHLRLPQGVKPTLPLGIQVNRDFATYRSTYAFENDQLIVSRELVFLKSDLPSTREADLEAFKKLVEKDHVFSIDLEGALPSPGEGAEETVAEITKAANAAFEAKDFKKAQILNEKVLKLDPDDKNAWNNLGRAHHAQGAYEKAIAAYRKAISMNPNEEYAYNNLGLTLWAKQKYREAEGMFRRQLEVNPYDTFAHGNLGRMLMETKAYGPALEELHHAARLDPKDAHVQLLLGEALLEAKDEVNGLKALEEATRLAPNPAMFNNAAYVLATRKVALGRAKELAESAIEGAQKEMKDLTLGPDVFKAGMLTAALGAYWDTLGWIHVQEGNPAQGEPYLRASWSLSQSSTVGVHLGRAYLALEQANRAEKAFALAAATAHPIPEARAALTAQVGGSKAAEVRIRQATEALMEERTLSLPGKRPSTSATGEFLLLLAPGGRVLDVQFLSGDERLRKVTDALKGLDHKVPLIGGEDTRIVRRAVVIAEPTSHTFSLMFMTSDSVLGLQRPTGP
ncbi:MAG: DUF3857 domain-containing protein [Acidobacteria bacterium]|nr:DUF3857 domain-containing protein [Acidobacteriota bacterium]